MFDMLTLEELHRLHDVMYRACTAIHDRMIGPDPFHPRMWPLGPEWAILSEHRAELSETMSAVFAEIGRRNAEDHAHA